jgi:hypothetical protein
VSAADGTEGRDDRALVVGPLAVPGFVLVLVGIRRRRRLFVLLGAVLVGLAVKLVERPRETAGGERPESENGSSAQAPEPEPEPGAATAPSSEPAEPAKPRKPRASATPKPPAAEPEPTRTDPDSDQPATT